MVSCISLVSLFSSYLRKSFQSAGLRSHIAVVDNGDTTLHYWLSSPSSSTPPGPLVVLIHGFGPESTWQWRYQIHPLASARFRILVPDLVFFGRSHTRLPHRSELFQAECVAKLLDTLGEEAFVPVGTSYGGFVAYHLARICGASRVPRVVIASSDLLKRESDDVMMRERAGVEDIADVMIPRTTATMRKLLSLAVHRPPGFVPEFFLRDFIQTLYSDNIEEKKELIRGLTLGGGYGLDRLASQEVLIIWGEFDQVFPVDKAYKIKDQIGENVTLEIIKNTSHLPQTEASEQFNKILIDFLTAS